ncbi:MAG TPA: hypothetical protein VK997_03765, partial [Deferrisomatales bacterium]|nr:hypothetical protein [Deferrisomatales bacterium]
MVTAALQAMVAGPLTHSLGVNINMSFLRWNNGIAVLVIVAVYFLIFNGPDSYLSEAVLDCTDAGGGISVFLDMESCADAQVDDSRYCPCYRQRSLFATLYYFWMIPVAFGVLGNALIKGTWGLKAGILTASIALGFVAPW